MRTPIATMSKKTIPQQLSMTNNTFLRPRVSVLLTLFFKQSHIHETILILINDTTPGTTQQNATRTALLDDHFAAANPGAGLSNHNTLPPTMSAFHCKVLNTLSTMMHRDHHADLLILSNAGIRFAPRFPAATPPMRSEVFSIYNRDTECLLLSCDNFYD